MFVLYFLLAILSIIAFKKHKDTHFIVLIGAMISGGFGFLPEPAPFKISDIILLVIVGCLLLRKHLVTTKNDKIGRTILILLGYYTFVTVVTIVLQRESIVYSLMVLRLDFYLLLYFLFRKMDRNDVSRAFSILRVCSIVTGVFFYLQLVGVTGFLNSKAVEDISASEGYARLANIPMLCTVMFFYSLLYDKGRSRIFYSIFFGGMIVVAQSRGLLMSSVASVLIFVMIKRQLKKSLKVLFTFLIVGLLAFPVISYRFSDSGSTSSVTSDIETAIDVVSNANVNLYDRSVIFSSGTFTFRLLMAKEKIEYLCKSPLTFLFGVGSLHGNSPSMNQFNFHIISAIDDDVIKTKQLDTTDVSFLTHLIKFGFIYLIIFFYLIVMIFKRLKSHNDYLSNVCLVLLLCKIIQCLGSDVFTEPRQMFFVLLIIAMDFNINTKKIQNEQFQRA